MTFAAHVTTGVVVILCGLWWAFGAIWTDFKKKAQKSSDTALESHTRSSAEDAVDKQLCNKSWIPAPCCPRVPFEPLLKVVMFTVVVITEAFLHEQADENGAHIAFYVYRLRASNGALTNLGKFFHIIGASGLLLSGIIDLLSLCCRFPNQANKFFFSLGILTHAAAYYFHLEGATRVNTHAHTILASILVLAAVFAALRMYKNFASSFPVNIGFAFSVILTGIWAIQLGVDLSPPESIDPLKWESPLKAIDDDIPVMYLSGCFTVHISVVATFLLVFWVILNFIANRLFKHKLCSDNCCLTKHSNKEELCTLMEEGIETEHTLLEKSVTA